MRRISIILFIAAALMTSGLSFAQTPGDRDGDGVGDSRDRCPDVAGPTASMGCPPDTDGDGTFDFEDACPTDGGHANNRGCPILAEPTPAETPQPEQPTSPPLNPNLPLASGPCAASTYLQVNVNGRSYPGASGEIVAQLDPNVLYPVLGFVALPDEEETYLVITMEDVMISSYSLSPNGTAMPFDPTFTGGVFVAASTMNVGGDCGPQPVGLLLPAVQAAREAARRSSTSATDEPTAKAVLYVRKAGGRGDTYYKVTFSDLVISSLTDADEDPAGAGKVSLQDFHFVVRNGEGEDGDQLIFDLVEAEPDTAAHDYLLKLDGIPGESNDAPPATDAFWTMITKLVQPDGESCEGTLLDTLADLGGELGIVPTDYGFDVVATLPADVEPGQVEQCLPGDGSVIPTEQMSLNFTKVRWAAAGDGSVRTTLMKVGPGTLTLGNVGLSDDGAVCVDLQPDSSQPLCVPNALPAVQ